jgi:hypothetical protein
MRPILLGSSRERRGDSIKLDLKNGAKVSTRVYRFMIGNSVTVVLNL